MFIALILSNTFKNLLRDQIINPEKWWFHTIDEIIEAPPDYSIYVRRNSITYYSLKKRANFDPKFDHLMNRINQTSYGHMFSLKVMKNFWERKCAGFMPSYHLQHVKLVKGNELVVNEIQYDHVLEVRSIRKDFEFSDKMIQL